MNEELKHIIEDDCFRHYAGAKKPFLWQLHNVALLYTITFRKAHYYSINKRFLLYRVLGIYWRFRLNQLSRKYLIQIPYPVQIGRGLNIVHFGRVIVAPKVKIGDNCNLFTGVTIGSTVTRNGKKGGVPSIGNSVWIGPNCVLVGPIKVGNNVLIAANSYINFDIPDNSIVIGERIIHSNSATEGYICQKV